jgi:hypothetical protein
MWPVMTLTLLLQLTDDEQLYATAPVEPRITAPQASAPTPEALPAAQWPTAEEPQA